jgi:preprotein translocase subunit Sec63
MILTKASEWDCRVPSTQLLILQDRYTLSESSATTIPKSVLTRKITNNRGPDEGRGVGATSGGT